MRIEENLADWKRGRFQIPANMVDIATFLLSDGALNSPPTSAPGITVSELFDRYFTAQPVDALEASSISTIQTHRRHFETVLGKTLPMPTLSKSHRQHYITTRARSKTRTRTVKSVTIKKELTTLSSVWNWGRDDGLTEGGFPQRGLLLPKGKEKPPFQAWEEIERKAERLDPGKDAQTIGELWDVLFLSVEQVAEASQYVRQHSRFAAVYPMLFLAAHTGALRSELLRSHVSDVNLDGRTVPLRETKRKHGHDTTCSTIETGNASVIGTAERCNGSADD